MRILVKYPTRSRPEKFKTNLQRYLTTLSDKHDVHFVISFDQDDESCNNSLMLEHLNELQKKYQLVYHFGPRQFKIGAINRDIPQNESWDFLVLASDDMEPVTTGWDDVFACDMNKYYPKLDGALNYNNDPRVEDFRDLITLPIIGRVLYQRFGYIYHPEYRSEFCDNEQTQVFKKLGVLTHIDSRPIWHNWYGNQDELMRFNMMLGSADRVLYEKRKASNFFLE